MEEAVEATSTPPADKAAIHAIHNTRGNMVMTGSLN
jgi:hypothetical protein